MGVPSDEELALAVAVATAVAGGAGAGLASAALAAEVYARGFVMMEPQVAVTLGFFLPVVVGFCVAVWLFRGGPRGPAAGGA